MKHKQKYRGIALGEFCKTKNNFTFALLTGQLFVRHSEAAIKQVVKELQLKLAIITWHESEWYKAQQGQSTIQYIPRY